MLISVCEWRSRSASVLCSCNVFMFSRFDRFLDRLRGRLCSIELRPPEVAFEFKSISFLKTKRISWVRCNFPATRGFDCVLMKSSSDVCARLLRAGKRAMRRRSVCRVHFQRLANSDGSILADRYAIFWIDWSSMNHQYVYIFFDVTICTAQRLHRLLEAWTVQFTSKQRFCVILHSEFVVEYFGPIFGIIFHVGTYLLPPRWICWWISTGQLRGLFSRMRFFSSLVQFFTWPVSLDCDRKELSTLKTPLSIHLGACSARLSVSPMSPSMKACTRIGYGWRRRRSCESSKNLILLITSVYWVSSRTFDPVFNKISHYWALDQIISNQLASGQDSQCDWTCSVPDFRCDWGGQCERPAAPRKFSACRGVHASILGVWRLLKCVFLLQCLLLTQSYEWRRRKNIFAKKSSKERKEEEGEEEEGWGSKFQFSNK